MKSKLKRCRRRQRSHRRRRQHRRRQHRRRQRRRSCWLKNSILFFQIEASKMRNLQNKKKTFGDATEIILQERL